MLVDRGAEIEAEYIVSMHENNNNNNNAPDGRITGPARMEEPRMRVCARAQNGMTPLHWAAFNGDVHVAAMLIGRGAAVESRTKVRRARDYRG